jgi:predicted DNA-binding protein
MYTYIMVRTQIYLSDEIDAVLVRLSRRTGRTKSQLIRDALERLYLAAKERDQIVTALRASAGAWRRAEGGAEYVESRRRGRLASLHGGRP